MAWILKSLSHESPSPIALSNEFSIDEYNYNEDLTYEEKGIDDTSVADVAHTNVEDVNEPINVCDEQIHEPILLES